MFGKREIIERNFPDFWIDLLEIPGTSYSDAKTRYTFRLDEYDNLWEYYFECFARLKQKININFSINDQGFAQEQSPGITAIREALVNMLIHADYFSPSHPRIRIFTNSIEFYNPGGFPKSIEELKNKDISLPRNPILTKLFRMIKLAENAGYGIDKIESNWQEYNNTTPEYKLDFDSTILIFNNSTSNEENSSNNQKNSNSNKSNDFISLIKNLGDDSSKNSEYLRDNYTLITEYLRDTYGINTGYLQDKYYERILWIISIITVRPNITTPSLANTIGVSESAIDKDLKKLKDENYLIREGSRKTGKWKIISKKNNI